MDFDPSWLLLGLPIAFVLGWLASRFDLRQLRMENRQAPKAYFRGLTFLLNEQQDQAIDAFIEAVQNDPDTQELHFALGNLFRRRGEYQRAVRVHEHLMSRGDLSRDDRHRAQHALAQDFLRAGLLDRAEAALHKLEGTRYQNEARLSRLAIYERSREWTQAAEVAQQLDNAELASYSTRLAHHLCEQAATRAGRTGEAIALLQRRYAQAPAIDVLEALIALGAGPVDQAHQASALFGTTTTTPRDGYITHLAHQPSLVAASRWLAGERLEHETSHPQVQRALDQAAKPLMRYRCAACGFEANQYFWHCPGCQAWDSYPPRRIEEL